MKSLLALCALLSLSAHASDSSVPDISVHTIPLELQSRADVGDAAAQEQLGEIYESRRGADTSDYMLAASWLRKSAEQGNAQAISELAALYTEGLGVLRNRVLAYALFDIAGIDGSPVEFTARRARILLQDQMSPVELQEAAHISKALIVQGSAAAVKDGTVNVAPVFLEVLDNPAKTRIAAR